MLAQVRWFPLYLFAKGIPMEWDGYYHSTAKNEVKIINAPILKSITLFRS
jgi:hypothetical protein